MAECEIWWATPSLAVPAGLLCARERARAAAFRQDIDAARYRVGAAMVRHALGMRTGVEPARVPVNRRCVCGADHGKPHWAGSGVHVSVTHAGGLVALAVADVPVGLDVEPRSAADRAWQSRSLVCGPTEQCREPGHVLRTWVAKEAVLKCTGDGLRLPMTRLRLSTAPPIRVQAWADHPELVPRLRLAELAPADHVATVAVLIDADGSSSPTGPEGSAHELQVRERRMARWGELSSV